jgi:hypothetical protein
VGRRKPLKGAKVAQKAEQTRAVSAALPDVEHEAADPLMDDEEKVLAGRPDANFPALLTKDVRGG